MKILHLTKKYPNALGGDGIVVRNLEKEQVKHNHSVYIVTSNSSEIINKSNVIKFGLNISPAEADQINLKRIISLIILFFQSFYILYKLKPAIIHSHSSDLGFCFSLSSRILNIPMINTCHGITFNDKQYSSLKRFAELFFLKYSGFKKILTVDYTSLPDLFSHGLPQSVFIPNGVDIKIFHKTINNRSKSKNILFVGRLEKQKGLTYLIKALNLVVKKKNKNVKLTIVGSGSQKETLSKLVKSLNLETNVIFAGPKKNEELPEYYSQSDIFVLPSVWEGFPLTLLEAWSSKLPCIVTNVGIVPKICVNGNNALVIKPKNVNILYFAIRRLLENKQLSNRLALNGYKLVKQKYSWNNVTSQIFNIYQKLTI